MDIFRQFAYSYQIPKLTKKSYKTNPPQYLFNRMTFDELSNVENFSIENENGKIKFKSKVNLTYLDLDVIDIIPGEIIINKKNQLFYPSPELILNAKVTIHLYNIDEIPNNISVNPLSLKYQIDKLKKKEFTIINIIQKRKNLNIVLSIYLNK